MTKKTKNKFTQQQKNRAVDDYLSGERTAKQIAEDLQTDVQTIYRWKVAREEKAKGIRVEELVNQGKSEDYARLLADKELEIELYQKKLAQQAIIIDLLKKSQTSEALQRESELSGLIRTINSSAQRKKRAKR